MGHPHSPFVQYFNMATCRAHVQLEETYIGKILVTIIIVTNKLWSKFGQNYTHYKQILKYQFNYFF